MTVLKSITEFDFTIEVIETPHGPAVTVKQNGGIQWDPTYGTTTVPVQLTPFEADKLQQNIVNMVRFARSVIAKGKIHNP